MVFLAYQMCVHYVDIVLDYNSQLLANVCTAYTYLLVYQQIVIMFIIDAMLKTKYMYLIW